MKLETLLGKLIKAGLKAEMVTVSNIGGSGKDARAIAVDTDYDGPYPTDDCRWKRNLIHEIGGKRFTYETRGYYTSCFIYERG